MRIQNLQLDEIYETLHSSRLGLTQEEATARINRYGKNIIEQHRKHNLRMQFISAMSDFFALVLWAAALICVFAAVYAKQNEMFLLAAAIVSVIVINAIFSFWQSLRAERALEALREILPRHCMVLRDQKWTLCLVENLVSGDVVSLTQGDSVPADIRLIECARLRVDAAAVTGESLPSARHSSTDATDDVLRAKNLVLAGCRVVAGHALGIVFATGLRSEFGKIAKLTLSGEERPTPLQEEIRLISKRISLLALALGLFFFIFGWLAGLSAASASLFAIGIIVANVPEGLMPTLTLSLALAAQRMAERKALVRRLPAVEALGSTTVICTDKTGTLTINKLKTAFIEVGGSSYSAKDFTKKDTLTPHEILLLRAMLWTHGFSERHLTLSALSDPIEAALVSFAFEHPAKVHLPACQQIGEIPFDDSRRRQSVIVEVQGEFWLLCKGAPEVVISRCSTEFKNDKQPLNFTARSELILLRAGELAACGMKVLAYAHRRLGSEEAARFSQIGNEEEISDDTETTEKNLDFLGLVALEDPIRTEVPEAVMHCRTAGIRIIMITGDHPETARYVATQSGIFKSTNPRIVLGQQVEHWSNAQLQFALEHPEIAFARVKATQKLRIVEALKNKHDVVAVTGDGINDAPALRHADVGIAMGLCGTDVARESADIILLDDNFATIVSAIREGRGIFQNIRNFMTYILASNVPEAIPYVLYVLLPIPIPLSIPHILAIDLGTDLIPALGLSKEPPAELIMNQMPRKPTEHLINKSLILRAYLWLGLWEAIAAMSIFFIFLFESGWRWGEHIDPQGTLAKQASTVTFCTVILMQVINLFLCRTRLAAPLNALLLAGLVIEVLFVLLVMKNPLLKEILATEALPLWIFPLIAAFMVLMLSAELIRRKTLKYFVK
ncbi:MAG: hypothetical protein RL189_44 [Pseudomonadota bacterium]|jgi:calcium-translocating P-type ATPase